MTSLSDPAKTVLMMEREALDKWDQGDPQGYLAIYASNATYFDPTLDMRIDGFEPLRKHLLPVTGQFTVARYELLNADVRVEGEMALLTYNLVNYKNEADGRESVLNRWNVTAVYQRSDGEWKLAHSHFSITKAGVA